MRGASRARAVTDKKGPLRCGPNARDSGLSEEMPPKRARSVTQDATAVASASSATAALPPPALERTAQNAYLYNEDLFGLDPCLSYRTRIITSCYVIDNIPAEVVRGAFAKAHIYPLSAVQELKRDVSCRDGGQAHRVSSRHVKDTAANAIADLGKRSELMSSSDVVLAAHAIITKLLKADKYAMRPMEEIAAGLNKRSKKVASAPVPEHKKVVGWFPPERSKHVADSFKAEDAKFQATHRFVCSEVAAQGCSRRFASWHWLKAHLLKEHKLQSGDLTQEQEVWRQQMMAAQKQAKASVNTVAPLLAVTADDLGDADDTAVDERSHGPWRCQIPYSEDEICGFVGELEELKQHYWDQHPELCGGEPSDTGKDIGQLYAANVNVIDINSLEEFAIHPSYQPLDNDTVRFMNAVLPASPYPSYADVQDVQLWLSHRGESWCAENFDELVADYLRANLDNDNVHNGTGDGDDGNVVAAGASTRKPVCATCRKPMKGHKRRACRPPSPRPSLSLTPTSPQSPRRTSTAVASARKRFCATCRKPMKGHDKIACRPPSPRLSLSPCSSSPQSPRTPPTAPHSCSASTASLHSEQ